MPALSQEIRDQITAQFGKYPNKRAVTLPALHIVHDAMRQVSIEAIREIAELLELHPSEVHDTMSFYNFFRTEQQPLGKKRVWVCRSISCALRGGEELYAELSKTWNVTAGHTSADGAVSLEYAECLGACEQAPCILVDDECHGNMDEQKVVEAVKQMNDQAPMTNA